MIFFGHHSVDEDFLKRFERSVLVSHEEKKLVEQSDVGSFDDFVRAYFEESV